VRVREITDEERIRFRREWADAMAWARLVRRPGPLEELERQMRDAETKPPPEGGD
jgi:hypothetical protein